MYVLCKDYPVMDGEPHLGSITECEEIWEKYEAEDLVIDQIFEEGGDYPYDGIFYAQDGYNDDKVPFNAFDVLDWDNLKVYLDSVLYVGCKLNKERMYAYAGVTSPKQRGEIMDYIDETQEMEQMGTERLVSEGFSLEMAHIQTTRRVSLNSEPVTVEQVKAEMEQTRMRCTLCEVKHEKRNPVDHLGNIT